MSEGEGERQQLKGISNLPANRKDKILLSRDSVRANISTLDKREDH